MTKTRKILMWVLILAELALLTFIFTRSMKDSVESARESGRLLKLLQKVFPWITDKIVRKTAHFTEFAALGAGAVGIWLCAGRNTPLPGIFTGMGAGITDELLQLTAEGRACRVTDMLLDSAGAACGALLLFLIARLILKRKKKKQTEKDAD